MDDAVVSFFVDRLGDLLVEQVIPLRGVKDDVVWLRLKLGYLLCFLKKVEEKQDVDDRTRICMSAIRDVAYEAEDIIEDFILKVEAGTPKKMGLKDFFHKCFGPNQKANLFGIGQEINALQTKLTQIEDDIRRIDVARQRLDDLSNSLQREDAYKNNEHVVGFKEDAEKLMSELDKEVKDRYVISIVGTGGLGKTTLVRKLYNNLNRKMFDRYAWVSVSTDYKIEDLLRSAIMSFKRSTTKEEVDLIESMNHECLRHYLHVTLEGHRYLVVLDDVWDVKVLACLMRAFPDQKNRSRIIMTTRNREVAQSSSGKTYVYQLPFLNEEDSWKLFCRKAFPDYNEVGNQKSCCPPGLESEAKEMASKCRGLPLAIVVLGGLLKKKRS